MMLPSSMLITVQPESTGIKLSLCPTGTSRCACNKSILACIVGTKPNFRDKLRPRCGSAALASIVGQGGCGMELALRFGISRGGGLVPCRHCLRESPSFPGVFGTCLLAPCGICIPLSGPGHYRPRGVVAHCCLRARSQGLARTRPGSGCVIRHRCSHNVAVF